MSRLVVFVTLLLVWGTTGAFACSCRPPTVEEAVHRADVVFLGTIKTLAFAEPNNRGSRVIVVFEVSRVWKGQVTRTFEMRSIVETTFCEGFFRIDLVVGKQLLVFANRVRAGLKMVYSTNICTFTGHPDRYGNTLQMLGASRLPS